MLFFQPKALQLFLSIISIAGATNVTNLSVTFYTQEIGKASLQDADYYKISQCNGASAGNTQVQVSVIMPDDPTLDSQGAWVACQASTCTSEWGADCFIASNFDLSDEANPNVTAEFVWTISSKTLYNNSDFFIRCAAGPEDGASYTLAVSYVSGKQDTPFPYSDVYFTGRTANSYNYLNQYFFSYDTYSVTTKESQYFFINFCENDGLTINSIDVTLEATPDYPLSAFELLVCEESITVDGCKLSARDEQGIAYDVESTPIASATLSSADGVDLTHGVFILVVGNGAESDLINAFRLAISAS